MRDESVGDVRSDESRPARDSNRPALADARARFRTAQFYRPSLVPMALGRCGRRRLMLKVVDYRGEAIDLDDPPSALGIAGKMDLPLSILVITKTRDGGFAVAM